MQTLYFSPATEAWWYIIPSDGWWFIQPVTRTVQFYSIEAAEAYLGVPLRSVKE